MPFKILIVDDEPDLELLIRQKFRRKIKDGEFEFAFAQNGQDALEKLKADPSIDLVMSDINMPVMDGLTLLSHISEINRILKTVIVSAYGDMQNIRVAMNRGAYDFLTKPIDFADFEATVAKTIHELDAVKEGLRAREQLSAIQQELGVASRIQQSMLPRQFPAFPGRRDFEIYAEMIPAREVGGDFYDFFLIDHDRLGFVIGDVSGKGIPAAIFMAVSRTLLRATALQGLPAGECMEYVNKILARQSESNMFVTIFYAILHTKSGELEYCIAGHNPPYVFSPECPLRQLDDPRGFMVGMFPNAEYVTGITSLAPGEGILLYTDGVTEANDGNDNEFTDERLCAVLERSKGGSVQEIVSDTIAEVRAFASAAAQSDDITAVAMRYVG